MVYAFAIFAEDPEIEIVPADISISYRKTERLTGRKDLVGTGIIYSTKDSCRISLAIAFIGNFKYPAVKDLKITSAKAENNKAIKFIPVLHHYDSPPPKTCYASLSSCSMTFIPEKVAEIKGTAVIEENSLQKVEIKNILSYVGKQIESKRLKELKISAKLEEFDGVLELLISGPHYWKNRLDNIIKFTKEKAFPSSAALSMGMETYPNKTKISAKINENALSEDSSMILNFFIPEKETTVPFTLKNIKVPK